MIKVFFLVLMFLRKSFCSNMFLRKLNTQLTLQKIVYTPECASQTKSFYSTITIKNITSYHSDSIKATFKKKDGDKTFDSKCVFKGQGLLCKYVDEFPEETGFYQFSELKDSQNEFEFAFENETAFKESKMCLEKICVIPTDQGIINIGDTKTFTISFDKVISEGNEPKVILDGGKEVSCEISGNTNTSLTCTPKKGDLPENATMVFSINAYVEQCGQNVHTGVTFDPSGLFDWNVKSLYFRPRCFSDVENFVAIFQLDSNNAQQTNYSQVIDNKSTNVIFKTISEDNTNQYTSTCSVSTKQIHCEKLTPNPEKNKEYIISSIEVGESNKKNLYIDDRTDDSACYSDSCLAETQLSTQNLLIEDDENQKTLTFYLFFSKIENSYDPKVIVYNKTVTCKKNDTVLEKYKEDEDIVAEHAFQCEIKLEDIKNSKGIYLSQADVYVEQCGVSYKTSIELSISKLIDGYGKSSNLNINILSIIAIIFCSFL